MHVGDGDFLARYPAFLPSFAIFVYTMTSLVLSFFALKETNVYCRLLSSSKAVQFVVRRAPCLARCARSEDGDGATDVIVTMEEAPAAGKSERRDSAKAPASDGSQDNGDARSVRSVRGERVQTQSTFAAAEGRSNPAVRLDPVTGEVKAAASAPVRRTHLSYKQALRIEPIRKITIFYIFLSASDMTYNEIMPLWAVSSRSVGGLDYFSDRVALILLVCSVPSVLANVLFHRMCSLINNNYILFWMVSTAIYTESLLLIPRGNKLGWNSGLWFVMRYGIVRQVGMSWAYSLIHMLTAKSAPAGCVGAVYGISQSFASLTRSVIPFFVAPLFAWSVSEPRPFPLNYYLLFLFAALCSLAGFIMAFFVRITRNAEDDAVDAAIAAEVAAAQEREDAAGSVGGAGSSDEDAEDAGLQEAYFSLVASFCTNPIQDAYMPLAELERVNLEARGEVSAAGPGGAAVASSPHSSREGEDGEEGEAKEVQPGSPTGGGRSHVIRARTAELLESLRSQQVESHRAAMVAAAGAIGSSSFAPRDGADGEDLPGDRSLIVSSSSASPPAP